MPQYENKDILIALRVKDNYMIAEVGNVAMLSSPRTNTTTLSNFRRI